VLSPSQTFEISNRVVTTVDFFSLFNISSRGSAFNSKKFSRTLRLSNCWIMFVFLQFICVVFLRIYIFIYSCGSLYIFVVVVFIVVLKKGLLTYLRKDNRSLYLLTCIKYQINRLSKIIKEIRLLAVNQLWSYCIWQSLYLWKKF